MARDEAPNPNEPTPTALGAVSPSAAVATGVELASDETSSALAWRILSSPRTLLVLTALLALLLALAATVPQRPLPAELARRLPFASADAASALGLDDVLVSWPALLLVLLIALNGAGILIARVLAKRRQWPSAGNALALVGLVGLGLGLAVSRGNALDARLTLTPGTGFLSGDEVVRDGDVFLPKRLPYQLMCDRPDPQDRKRAFDCTFGGIDATPVPTSLAPGFATRIGDLELRPLRERLRGFAAAEVYDVVLARGDSASPSFERLRLEPDKTIVLRASGQRLTALPGPDGPLVVVEADGQRPVLLGPPAKAVTGPTSVAGTRLEVERPSALEVALSSTPEALLVLVGAGLFALGLLIVGAELRTRPRPAREAKK